MKATKIFISIILWGLIIQPLSAQESILKEEIESKRDKKFALYPSTLRMVNLQQNEDYNQLVSGVEKLLIYTLDSATQANKSYTSISAKYLEAGFDEYASIFGGDMTLSILGKTSRNSDEYVGYFAQKNGVFAFYLKGQIPWQKIPTLINNIQDLDVINFFDVKTYKF
ncbi:MAG: DUF4252 domain-containing protein [Marinoscillum sp.]